jgi:pimeloyl-ACP methyl ester carboxylesterase
LERLSLGGAEQWVLVRGHDSARPVILFLHGGPGMPAMFLAHAFQSELERDFVVVHWDRRGAGKSYQAARDRDRLTVQQTLADTLQLSQLLRERFNQERIYLVGHSWGTYLALLAARDRPDYYAAYVGMGQLAGTRAEVEAIRREFVAGKARQLGEEDFAGQVATGAHEPNEDDLFRYGGELYGARSFWPILLTGLRAPEYTLWDALRVRQGATLVARGMKYDLLPRPLEGEIADLRVPVFLFLGRYDYNTPSSLAAAYLQRLASPLKELIWFEHSAHFVFFEEAARFHSEMLRVDAKVGQFWRQALPSSREPDGGQPNHQMQRSPVRASEPRS